jgi:hypothetical protein
MPLTLIIFAAASWLSRPVLLATSAFDLTLPKLLLGLSVLAVLAARPWQFAKRFDRYALLFLALVAGWLIVGSALRGDPADLKRTAGAVVFGAAALVLTWAAVRTAGGRGSRWIAVGIAIFGVVSFAAAALELATWNVGDPFLWLWNIARPQTSFLNEPGVSVILQTHSMGADRVLRVSGLSWHPNILAMSMLMPAAFALALVTRAWSSRQRLRLIGGAVLFALVATTIVWTQSRSAFLGLLGVLLAATVVAWYAFRARRGAQQEHVAQPAPRGASLAPMFIGVPLIVLALALDSSIIERLIGSITPGTAHLPGQQVSTASNAADIAAIHWQMISTGLHILAASPAALIAGPGLSAYTLAVHDPANALYLPSALGIPDPNSFWLSFALGGGLPVALAILGLIGVTWWQLVRRWRADINSALDWTWRHLHRAWLLAWIPAWVIVENVGGNPLEVAEMIPFAMLVGLSVALVAES